MSVARFTADLARFDARVRARARAVVKGVAVECAKNIVVGGEHAPGTPVDTGFARGNWWVQAGEGGGGTAAGAPDPGGSKTLDAAVLTIVGTSGDDSIFILNNTVYIRELEYGHSRQAPNGMVRLTLNAGQRIVEGVVRKLGAS